LPACFRVKGRFLSRSCRSRLTDIELGFLIASENVGNCGDTNENSRKRVFRCRTERWEMASRGRLAEARPQTASLLLHSKGVHGELLIKRRSVFGTGHDSVLAKRTPQIGSSR
jgi:hypothetical protein